jgi:hypothetical protein
VGVQEALWSPADDHDVVDHNHDDHDDVTHRYVNDVTDDDDRLDEYHVSYPPGTTTPVYYDDCTEVIDAGKAPIASDVPGYRLALDRDRDGLGCELEELVSDVTNDRDLASTGASPVRFVVVGTLLLIGGVVLTVVAVRRRRSGETT